MKLATLLLTAAIALGAGVSGTAMAHGSYDHAHGPGDHGRLHGIYRHGTAYRHHQPRHRYWSRHYRPPVHGHWRPPAPDDSRYGIHLFFGSN